MNKLARIVCYFSILIIFVGTGMDSMLKTLIAIGASLLALVNSPGAKIPRHIVYAFICLALYTSASLLISVGRGYYDGIDSVIRNMIVLPIVVLGLASGISRDRFTTDYIDKYLRVASLIIIIFTVGLFFIGNIIGIDIPLPSSVYAGSRFDEAIVENRNSLSIYLLFLLPYLSVSRLFTASNGHESRRTRNANLFLMISATIICMISGRRVLQLMVLIVIALVLFSLASRVLVALFSKRVFKTRLVAGLLALFLAIGSCTGIVDIFLKSNGTSAAAIVSTIYAAFDVDSKFSTSAVARRDQARELLDAFLLKPFFGYGATAHAGLIRSDTNKSSYELTLHALAFQYGLIGICIIIYFNWALLSFVFRNKSLLVSKVGTNVGLGIIAGSASVYIGCLSNPLNTFVPFWVPLASCFAVISNQKMYAKGAINRNEQ